MQETVTRRRVFEMKMVMRNKYYVKYVKYFICKNNVASYEVSNICVS